MTTQHPMTTPESNTCHCCGAKLVEYRFVFNYGLALFLGRLFDNRGPTKTDTLGLTYSQRTNSQKLRYWGLAEPYLDEHTEAKRGWWQITDKGRAFVMGEITIPKYAVTKRNHVLRLEGEPVSFRGASRGYQYRQDYADQIRAQLKKVEPPGQLVFA